MNFSMAPNSNTRDNDDSDIWSCRRICLLHFGCRGGRATAEGVANRRDLAILRRT